MNKIEFSNIIKHGTAGNVYYEMDVTYRQIVPDSIVNDPVLLAKSSDIASLSGATYEIIDGVHCVTATKHYSFTYDSVTFTIIVDGDSYIGNLEGFLAKIKTWYDEGTEMVNGQAAYLLNNTDVPELLTGKYYDGTQWKDKQ